MTRTDMRRRLSPPRRYSLGMMLMGWMAIGLTVILVGGTLYGYVKYRDVLDGIYHVHITDPNAPKKLNSALNVLVIGSDNRSGRNGDIGGPAPGQRSDTVMLAHISPGSGHITVLSFPRDTAVPIYACPDEPGGFPGQNEVTGSVEQLNTSFSNGGANCLWKTVERITGVHLDNFVQINFTGFISVINAIGGVPVCLPSAIHKTRYDRLKLSAGRHVLKGYKALQFWRLREGFGLGSDLQRIQRDQLMMVGLVQKILKTGILQSFSKTWAIINAISESRALTTDSGLSPGRMVSIARSVSGISRTAIQFIEVPTVTYPNNPNWVEFDSSKTPQLFDAIQRDRALPKTHKGGKGAKGSKNHKAKPVKLVSSADVNLTVLNGSGVPLIAGTTATALSARGFHILGTASAMTPGGADDYSYTKSVVEYSGRADLAAAETVAAQLPDAVLRTNSSITPGTVTLILGSAFTKLGPPPSQPVGDLTGKFGGYHGSTNPCKGYGTAFTGATG